MQETTVPVILVTGGTGFVGSHLVEALQAKYPDITIHVTSFGSSVNQVDKRIVTHQLDLANREATFDLISTVHPTHIYHLASYAVVGNSFENAQKILSNNTALQLNLLDAVKLHAPSARLLVVGSAEEYGITRLDENQKIDENFPLNPANPYAVSKVTQDMLAYSYSISFDLDIIRVRPFNHTGERQSPHFAIPSFAKQIVEIEKGSQAEIKVGNLDGIRDFSDVKDVVQAYILLMEKGQKHQLYNIGSGQGHAMRDLLTKLCQMATVPIKIVQDPSKIRPLDVPRLIADNGKIASLGWKPTYSIENTLERVLMYWRTQS